MLIPVGQEVTDTKTDDAKPSIASRTCQINDANKVMGFQSVEKKVTAPKPVISEPPKLTPESTVVQPPRVRHEWYQTDTHVCIDVFIKNVPKQDTKTEIEEKSVSQLPINH